ncbi:NAD(P)/FAD-dependent oxidoreductase [Diaphorobacter sp. HDW4A]|uniref:NAD(P)/FAD-dependent oxidoreductase n=1 Tax=Diaphorobacter sp. HDW4A TaxID=2714924 RepID=UPI0014080575|nr:NAD(P)/FAD-dependent oxidoreductase [Diaphorobacter sp. HDW4A]QIL80466.1 NAD(P)/FAD-dependent oxidoreductase [Diaphorobacter sp. HDW4A]
MSNTDLAPRSPIETDAAVIGAGPVGLFQVFQLGLQGIHAHLIDALPHPGGQCAELYPDKPIYDIPGIKVCTGRELAAKLREQIAPFAPTEHLGEQIATLTVQPDGRILLGTSYGTQLLARSVFIAAGVGAFVPRALKLEGIEPLVGSQVFYHPASVNVASGKHVTVHGGDEAAVRAAIECAEVAQSVTLLHRRDVFQAEAAELERLQTLRDAGRIRVLVAQITGLVKNDSGQLTGLQMLDGDGNEISEATELLLVYLGISPRLGPISDWGIAIERKQLVVDPASFATSVTGIYAVGDINTYPGKRRLILCGFHEATLAAFAAAEHLSAAPVALQYTTTSAKLHERLGVEHHRD